MSIQPISENFAPLSESKKELLKKTFGGNMSDDELDLFGYICGKTGLDPFIKQIYPISRRTKRKDGTYEQKMTTLVGIDGLRSIAERTGNYCPGKETTYNYDQSGAVVSATAFVKKKTNDGTWHEISVTAHMNEYRPEYNNFWNDKPHIMLGKCAEALCIRKAFPSVTANLYISEEMQRSATPQESISCGSEVQRAIQPEIIDPEANLGHLKEIEALSSFDSLSGVLKNDGVNSDRLAEWIVALSKTKGMEPNEVIANLLKVLPSFKKSYTKWLKAS